LHNRSFLSIDVVVWKSTNDDANKNQYIDLKGFICYLKGAVLAFCLTRRQRYAV